MVMSSKIGPVFLLLLNCFSWLQLSKICPPFNWSLNLLCQSPWAIWIFVNLLLSFGNHCTDTYSALMGGQLHTSSIVLHLGCILSLQSDGAEGNNGERKVDNALCAKFNQVFHAGPCFFQAHKILPCIAHWFSAAHPPTWHDNAKLQSSSHSHQAKCTVVF